jgi:hypothetical protein
MMGILREIMAFPAGKWIIIVYTGWKCQTSRTIRSGPYMLGKKGSTVAELLLDKPSGERVERLEERG